MTLTCHCAESTAGSRKRGDSGRYLQHSTVSHASRARQCLFSEDRWWSYQQSNNVRGTKLARPVSLGPQDEDQWSHRGHGRLVVIVKLSYNIWTTIDRRSCCIITANTRYLVWPHLFCYGLSNSYIITTNVVPGYTYSPCIRLLFEYNLREWFESLSCPISVMR